MPSDSKRDRSSREGSRKNEEQLDDFTVIEGMGEALDQWLRENFKVRTYADLAALSAQKIRSRAKQTGLVLSLAEIEAILAQARERAGTAPPPVAEGEPESPAPAPPAAPPEEEENAWEEFAIFVVSFERKGDGDKEEKRTIVERRTGIHHMETGEQGRWPGVDAGQACQWMLERLGEKAEEELEERREAAASPAPAAAEPVALEILGIQLRQPPSSEHPSDLFAEDRPFSGVARGGEPLSLTVTFKIVGARAFEVAKAQREFSVLVDAEDLSTSAVSRISTSTPRTLKEGQLSYTVLLSPSTFSAGVYLLRVSVIVRDPQPFWSYVEVPRLQVA